VKTLLAIACAAAALGAGDSLQIAAAARAIQPGELVVLTMTLPDGAGGLRVRAFDRNVPVFAVGARTWRALIGIDLDVAPAVYPVSIVAHAGARPLHATHELDVQPKNFATRTLQVEEGYVNPPPSVQERIERDAAALRHVWQSAAPERLWTGTFVRPVPGESVSRFGSRSVFNGQPRSPHSGGDFMSPAGTPIHAPNAGRVALARDLYFSGNTVVIDHGLGLFSTLAHMSAIDVREGEMVGAGQIVGRVGATGRVTGPHLHWAVRVGTARVDPLALLAVLGTP
jgi:murein DD-endopeptidase MepM/ murein hydrolase activator NlpD